MSKLSTLLLIILIILVLILISLVVGATSVTWTQSRFNQYTNFNGCVDNPANPNPIQTKNMPINFTNSVASGDQIFVIVSADSNVSGGGCLAMGLPFITSVTDNAGTTYSRFGTYTPNQGSITVQYEIWMASSAISGAQQLTITMGGGKLHVGAVIYDFNGVFTQELIVGPTSGFGSTNGDSPFSVTWNNTAGVFLPYFFTTNGACPDATIFPNCIYPATTQSAGTGGYNENNIGVACPVPPSGGCTANVNSNGKPGGGDNDTLLPASIRIQTARITSNTTGAHTFYWHTTSPQSTTVWIFGLMLYPSLLPQVTTLSADLISTSTARLNGNLVDLGAGSPNASVWFSYGNASNNLTINTTIIILTNPGTFSASLNNLQFNTTYYFVAVANNSAGQSNGTILSFTTQDNIQLKNFIAYGWTFAFIGALILGLMGAYWIKRRREEH